MEPGLPGLLALPAVAAIGWLLSIYFVATHGALGAYARLAGHSIAMVTVATVFWFWAAYKLLALGDPDMGVATFLVAIVCNYRTADLCAVVSKRPGRTKIAASLNAQRWIQPAADVAVLVNYVAVLALLDHLPILFRAYLIVGAAFWALAAMRSHWLHGHVHASLPLSDVGAEPEQDERHRLTRADEAVGFGELATR